MPFAIEQILDVPANGRLTIQLPASLKNSKRVKIVINEVEDTAEAKISLLNKAVQDKDFLADLHEVNKDFESIDSKING
jgi:hypothetical protein